MATFRLCSSTKPALKPSDPSCLLPSLPQGAEILIARLRSLGDIVLETPAIAALHQWRPDLRIFALVEERFAAALTGNPAISGLLFSRAFLRIVAELRQRKFSVVFNQHGGPRSALLTAASGAASRIGWKGFQYSFVYNMPVPDAAEFYGRPIVHTVEHRMSQFYYTGLPRAPIPAAQVFPQPHATDRVRKILNQRGVAAPYAILQPDARIPAMRWSLEKFAEIARWLRERHGIPSVVNLPTGDSPSATHIRTAFGNAAVVPEPLGLSELIALISGAALFIGNDSGPVHLAAAAGTPAVVIYGTTNPAQWHPWRSEHRVVATGAEFQAVRGDKSIAINQPRTITSIPVDEVRLACEELLAQKIPAEQGEDLRENFNRAEKA